MTERSPSPRYVFVGGLHRSGTSLLARLIASHPAVSALHAPEVPESEGVYVQGAIPHTARHGIPGAFAFDPAQHMTEAHALNTLETRLRLERDWGPRFDPDAPWRVEKSPVNMLRMRLYQQLFPLSHHVVITRHPVAVAQATSKWTDASLQRLVDHWGAAHRLLLADLPWLHAALVIRYEDLVATPDRMMRRVAAFLGLDPAGAPAASIVRDGNARYDAMPSLALPGPAALFGYGARLQAPHEASPVIACRHPLNAIQNNVHSVA